MRWPYGAATWSPIHERDIAAVAVRALTEDAHGGKKYTLTGGELLTQVEQLQIISQTIGRNLHYEELTPDLARQQISAFLPPFVIDRLLDLWAGMVERPLLPTRTVEEITGAAPIAFLDSGLSTMLRISDMAIQQIEAASLTTAGLYSKLWEEFAKPDAPVMNFVLQSATKP